MRDDSRQSDGDSRAASASKPSADGVGFTRIVPLDANIAAEDLPRQHCFLARVLACRRQRFKSAVRAAGCQINEVIIADRDHLKARLTELE